MSSIYNKYIFNLPIIPQVVSEILKIPANSNISSKEIEDILKVDPYLTSRLLKIANSSYYSRQREIKSIKDSITLIGLKKIKAICLLIAGSEIIENKNEEFFQHFWSESINTAFISKAIANETGKTSIEDDIFTGGILHNIGQAILYNFSNDKYNKILVKIEENIEPLVELEKQEFGIDNHKVAAGVLQSWEFPELHIEIVKNYLNATSHSNFQSILDVISISKLLYKKHNKISLNEKEHIKFLTYQSRLNLRNKQIQYYIDDFFKGLKDDAYYKICNEAIRS